MKFLYNFGMSQDDAETERKALDLRQGDRLICIASAGEVPLNLLASSNVHIDAVDLSLPQIQLARLKMTAAIHLEPQDAARFIGYKSGSAEERICLYKHLFKYLDTSEKTFWDQYPAVLEKGPIHAARFERYLSRFNWLGLHILNRKKMMKLFEFDNIAQQKLYFDQNLESRKLKRIFKIAFHPKIYKKRAMDNQGLLHSGKRDIAAFFFSRFRNFCTSTLARKNYFLQFTFFNRILFDEALPEYLKEDGNQLLKKRINQLAFYHESVSSRIQNNPKGNYNKFGLSNVGDWLSHEEYADLLQIICKQSEKQSRALLRYIHFAPSVPENLTDIIKTDQQLGHDLESIDRYPFYSLMPMRIKK